ncbi:MAG TPA: glycosyltransferase [Candidatus Acidoferrum sp.]|jgi:glycosyltransferase involved in cell wall biosynthesis|nr:glycosyltransferase [Candidatus Acidoferrum sp.]
MKVLMVSKAAAVAAHRGKLAELAKLGVDLTVIVPPRWGSQPLELTEAHDYKVRVVPCFFTPYNHFHFYPARIGPIDADIVYLEEEPWSLVTYQFMRLCVKANKPAIFSTLQNIDKYYPPPFNLFERYAFHHASAAVAGAMEMEDLLRKRGFDKHVSIITLGCDPDVFAPRDVTQLRRRLSLENTFIVGFVGRIIESKGIADLVRAFAQLPSDCVLLMLGDGDFRAEAERLSSSLGINSRIRWVSQVASLEVPDYMNLLDVMVLPSHTTSKWKEQFGRVLVEAMACEKPVVGSSSAEIPNVIGDAGLVFPERDVEAMVAQLRTLYQDAALRVKLGHKARIRVLENFSYRKIAEKHMNLFQQVLAANIRDVGEFPTERLVAQ